MHIKHTCTSTHICLCQDSLCAVSILPKSAQETSPFVFVASHLYIMPPKNHHYQLSEQEIAIWKQFFANAECAEISIDNL